MAEKENGTHTEPMTAEMKAAVKSANSADKAPAKKSAPKKSASVKKKSAVKKKAAPKKKSAVKKKAAPKKKSAVKKKAAPTTAAVAATAAAAAATSASATEQPTEIKLELKAESSSAKSDSSSVSDEQRQHQQEIRQKLVDLGVADPEEIGAVAHDAPPASSRPFWIKAIIALLILVGLYFYSKESNHISTTPVDGQPVVAPLEQDSSQGDVATLPADDVDSATDTAPALTEGSASEMVPADSVNENSAESDDTTAVAEESGATETMGAIESSADQNRDEPASGTAASTPAPAQYYNNYMPPAYAAPNPWNPDYYPPFNSINQVAPVNPYYYPPVNMAPAMVPPPYYTYPAAPYYPQQPAAPLTAPAE